MTRKYRFGRSFIAVALSALCAVVFLMVSGSAGAQLAGKGAVSGTVQDPTGASIPGATITATNTVNGVSTSTTSTSAGDFTIPTLDAGIYTIVVTANGFEKLTQQNVQINSLETQTFNPKMTVGGGTENVTVTTIPPQLETTNATLGATMDQEMYSALPIEMGAYGNADQRRATDFAFLMPGVQGNNVLDTGNPTTNTGIVNGSGSRGAVSDVYIDGVAFVRAGGQGDPRYVWTAISVDAVDQFQLQTTGYSAVYEGNGIQNYTIKEGGKQYHGSLYEFFRNTALDTWGFLAPAQTNPATGKPSKPIENSNEFGINLSGPLAPFGNWKNKLFFFGNYGQFRYASATPTAMEVPTAAQQAGNFQGVLGTNSGAELSYIDTVGGTGSTTNNCLLAGSPAKWNCAPPVGVYDPSTQTACTGNSTSGPCRYRYGYVYGGAPGPLGNPILGPGGTAAVDAVPAGEFSTVAKNLQQFLPTGESAALSNNYIAPNKTGLVNWSTTDRIDYIIGPKDTFTAVMALGRQASSNPVGQTTAGRNVANIPYNFGQAYAPKTAVGVVEESHVFTPHLVNQFKYGYARYNGPTFDSDQLPQYSATTMGLSGLPSGPASNAFPFETWAGTNAPTNWAGEGPSVTLAENYTLVDNVQWIKGRHNFTFGGQVAWLLYNVINATGGSTPLTLAFAVTETAGITPSTNNSYAAAPSTGLSYASYLVGQVDKASYTQYLQQEFGARFRPISPYVQDNWKVNSRLTLDLGLRWDYYPTITEVHNAESFFSPTLTNTVTNLPGALQFTGTGAGTCNCSTPVNNWKKNFGPRIGLAFQSDPKTVWRASYDLIFSHGNAVGGNSTSLGTLGFSAAPAFSVNGSLLSTAPLTGTNGAIPPGSPATGVASGPGYGTGYTTFAGYTTTPSGEGYPDPYLGGRAPEFETWTFGFQHQWTSTLSSTMSYVGSQGHFLPTDGTGSSGPRGYWNDALNPTYLSLNTALGDTGATLTAFCAAPANAGTCPSYTSIFNTSQSLATLLKPFPFQTVTDSFGYVANANYNALQATLTMRPTHGLSFMANYTWSKSIDDGGTFRTGYPIPAGTIAGEPGVSWKADRIERSASTTNQPQHVVVTGVYALPFGRTVLSHNAVERAILGGFKLSEVLQMFSGSPMAVTGSSCQTNPAQGTCNANYNPNFSGPVRINGKWGQGVTAAEIAGVTGTVDPVYIAPSGGSSTVPTGPFIAPSVITATSTFAPPYTFANGARTAPYGLYSPGNYDLDLALVRSFPLHFTEAASFDFRAEMYNVTNHTWFSPVSAAVGNAGFGEVTINAYQIRKAVQLSARLNF